MAATQSTLKTLIAKGKLAEALEQLVRHTMHTKDSDLRQRVLTLSGQFTALKNQQLAGLLEDKDYRLQWNRISAAVADMAEQERFDQPALQWKKWAAILGVLAAISGIAGYTLRDFWRKPEVPAVEKPAVVPVNTDTLPALRYNPAPAQPTAPVVQKKNHPASAQKEVKVKVDGDVKNSNIIIGDGNHIKRNQ